VTPTALELIYAVGSATSATQQIVFHQSFATDTNMSFSIKLANLRLYASLTYLLAYLLTVFELFDCVVWLFNAHNSNLTCVLLTELR